MGFSLGAFIVVIGILVFIHEFGHFIVARLCGVGVEVFSLGFGPKIFTKNIGGTEYCISAIPLGGYVKMVGQEPGTEAEVDDPEADNSDESFNRKKLWQKSLIVAAGPVFNFLLAIFIFYGLYQFVGVYMGSPVVGEVMEDSPALAAGIKPGDVIKKINQKEIESFEDVARIIASGKDRPLKVIIERNGLLREKVVTPMPSKGKNAFGEEIDKFVIGIIGTAEPIQKRFNPVEAMGRAFRDTYAIVNLTLVSVVKMIEGSVSKDNLAGPIMIAQMAGKQAKAGIENFAWFIALLSVNLGIINLFPIPVLDGGHLLFFAIEAVTGKPVNDRLREKLMQVGAALLVTFMVFVFYNDIVRMISGA
ncbi:MAG: RIP metalloprotease RseP [Desulfobacterales bacterium]|nr:RIP metalloprotease RseP [Desulfobacterales bacterium]